MAVRAKCPKCDTSYTLADGSGKTVRCRQCGEGFLVGAAPQDEAAKEAWRIAKIRQEGFATPSKAKMPREPGTKTRRSETTAAVASRVIRGSPHRRLGR